MSFIKFPMKTRNAQRLMLELTGDWLKWAMSQGTAGSWDIVDCGVFQLVPDKKAAREKLEELVKKYKIQPQEVFSCVPRYQVTARNLELPSTQPSEIKKIIDLQAVKQTPYAVDEIVFDYYLLKAHREGYSSVLLVVAHREVINTHLRTLEEMGLNPAHITLATQCSVHRLSAQLEGWNPEQIVAVLDVDVKHTDFFVFRGTNLLFTQNLSPNAERLAEDGPKWQEKLLEEISRSLQIYRSEEIAREPERLVLAGAVGGVRPVIDRLAATTGLAVIESESADLVRRFLKPPADPAWAKKLSFSAIAGLAFLPRAPFINLVPQEVIIKASILEKGRRLFMTGILSLSLFLVAISFFAQNYYRKQAYLKWLEDKLSVTQKSSEEVTSARRAIQEVIGLHESNLRLLEALVRLHEMVPKGIYFTEINLTKDNRFQIQGRAESMTSVFDFVNSLKSLSQIGRAHV